jgi:hypothetical protein
MMDSWLTQVAIATPIRTPVSQVNWNKLSKSGSISDDGQVIVFHRDEAIYATNADGNDERLIVDSKSLPTLGQGEITALTFKPNSHFLLFNTYLCNPRPNGPSYNAPDCTVGIYGVDTDSGDVAQIIAGLSGNTMHNRNFEISPDGQYISVASSGQINIYRGRDIYYQNAIVYNITRPDEYLPRQFWLPDSSGILAIVATDGYNEPGTPPWSYAVYRYKLGETAVEIPFNIPIVRTQGDTSCVSPDRNWILFAGTGGGQLSNIWSYLGSLNNGQIQAFEEDGWLLYDCQWSPDSRHFVSTRNAFTFIGSIDGSLPTPVGGHFLGWIDNTHYYYMTYKNGSNIYYIGEITDN